MVDLYADNEDVVFITVSDQFQTSQGQVETWLSARGWEMKTVLDNSSQNVFQKFGETRDTFMVFDKNHKLHYKKTYGSSGPGFFPSVIANIDSALEITAVESETWSQIKRLYQP
ncbi:MAG: hypothetical protein HKN21_07850 [Candidatus Eisenbacteria bacterium]|uniref:Uncharacterized protein n=1 Tax=Eiseniibacteriota bacterium TaxID=2212470 RepID=A0A7Y2EER0_UNCEI|nr:hypothetical protein [Candidatus Eisenbacteria bacterium]